MKKMKKIVLSVVVAALVLSILPLGTVQTAHAASVAQGKNATYISKIDPFVVTGEVARYRLTRDDWYVCPTNSDYYAGYIYGIYIPDGGSGDTVEPDELQKNQDFKNLASDKSLEGTDLDLRCLDGMDDIIASDLNATNKNFKYEFKYYSRELIVVDDNTKVSFNMPADVEEGTVYVHDSHGQDFQVPTGYTIPFNNQSTYYLKMEATAETAGWAVEKLFATSGELSTIEDMGFRLDKISGTGQESYDPNFVAIYGLAQAPMSNDWYLYNHGDIDYSYTGLYYDQRVGWWYVQNGKVMFDYTGLVYDPNVGWWYVQNGAINFDYTGLVYDPNVGWWYVENGAINFNYTGLVCDSNVGWWYVENGAINFNATGLVANEYGWWFVQNGTINFNYTGLVPNDFGWWYVQNGAINFDYNGLAYDPYVGWWVVNNGAINFGYTGMIANDYGWWYAVNGALDLNATGWACNEYGWWLYYNGTIAWNYTGWWDGFYCVNGHLA